MDDCGWVSCSKGDAGQMAPKVPSNFRFMALNVSGLTMTVRGGEEGKGDISRELVSSRKRGLVFWGGPEFWCMKLVARFC